MSDLESKPRYDPSEVEPRIEAKWLQSGLYHAPADGTADENYSIAIPPPNVTGVLHMGHALNNAIQDCLTRYHRMAGERTKWIVGTDHAGIATQTQVERLLVEEGSSREEIGRDAFVERVWRWRDQYGGQIIEQLKRLGASCDFEEERFTLDDRYVQAVQKVFVSLYEKGYIYRDRYMVNWDPGSRSAISDLEVEEREVTDTLYYVDYPLASGTGAITVATVRPETMLADVAIAVNPTDERYRRLVGETAILPLVGRKLRIIADDYVKPEFGTGALKITPGHDPNDFEIGLRHGLAQLSAIGEDGRITAEAPERFVGLGVAEAQQAIADELREQGLLARTEAYTHTVPFSHRSGERIEPLVSLQWFMRMDELARPAIEVVRSGDVKFHPERWGKVYLDWMEKIRPWCVSRQLWWGHQLPVYYRRDQTYVGTTPPEGHGWERDPDVLDTWFSSALWPFATLGWPEPTPELPAFYPTDALVTARDIIFLWVARMIMMGIEFLDEVPFSDVYVTSLIQAPDGRRMSKSLGTGIDPLDLINGGPRPPLFAKSPGGDPGAKSPGRDSGESPGGDSAGARDIDPGHFPAYGADAVRWGVLAMSSGQDVRFSEDKVAQGQQLANKLWNASRLILLRVDPATRAEAKPTAIEDTWMLNRLSHATTEVARRIGSFDFSAAAFELYDFVYGELCDWYLELVKPRLYDGDPDTAQTLLAILTQTLELAHPLIPFVTEEIYAHVPGAEGLLAARVRDDVTVGGFDEEARRAVESLIAAVQAVRTWRDSAEVRPAATLAARIVASGYEQTAAQLSRLARLDLSESGETVEAVASVPIPGGAIEILPTDELDLGAAERRRAAARERLVAEISRAEKKLANDGFVAKAPEQVVTAERDKLARLRSVLKAL